MTFEFRTGWFREHRYLNYCLAGYWNCGTSIDFEIAVADIFAGAGVEIAVGDIAADVVEVPTLFNLIDALCCNNYDELE